MLNDKGTNVFSEIGKFFGMIKMGKTKYIYKVRSTWPTKSPVFSTIRRRDAGTAALYRQTVL